MMGPNGSGGLMGPDGKPLPLHVPDLSPKQSSWKCDKCGFEPQDMMHPQLGKVPQDANFTQIAGEKEPWFGCLRCWIKFQRKNMGQLVPKERLLQALPEPEQE